MAATASGHTIKIFATLNGLEDQWFNVTPKKNKLEMQFSSVTLCYVPKTR
jgi:hypothetical protein